MNENTLKHEFRFLTSNHTLPLFLLGFVVRLGLIMAIVPQVQQSLFIPFFQDFLANPVFDPWDSWMSAGNSSQSFPYGIIMLLVFLPMTLVGLALDPFLSNIGLTSGAPEFSRGIQIGFALTILILDLILFNELRRWLTKISENSHQYRIFLFDISEKSNDKFLMYFYWLSPLVVYINYIHGQIDIWPTLLIILSVRLLAEHNARSSAVVFTCAVFAKVSVIIIFPFLLFYVYYSPRGIAFFKKWITALCLATIVLIIVSLVVPGQFAMIAANNELTKTLTFGFELPTGASVLLFGLVYFLGVSILFFLTPIDQRTLYKLIASVLIVLVSLSSVSIGWYLWIIPFMLVIAVRFSGRFHLILFLFWLFAIGLDWMIEHQGIMDNILNTVGGSLTKKTNSDLILSVLTTLVFGLSVLIATQILKNFASENVSYRIINRPILIGVAGDSGVGKDTLTFALSALVAKNRSTVVLGDDYHVYARGAPMWQALTHLNPKANHLPRFFSDINLLSENKSVSMHHYDHVTGTFSKPRNIRPASLTIVNGLHALYSSKASYLYNLRIFIDMDEGLRRSLKIIRDTQHRGKSLESTLQAIEDRKEDGLKFIRPQMQNADIIFAIRPIIQNEHLAKTIITTTTDFNTDMRLCLDVSVRAKIDLELIKLGLLSFIDTVVTIDDSQKERKKMTIYASNLTSHNVKIGIGKILGPMKEFMAIDPDYKAGFQGAMQIVSFAILEQLVAANNSHPQQKVI